MKIALLAYKFLCSLDPIYPFNFIIFLLVQFIHSGLSSYRTIPILFPPGVFEITISSVSKALPQGLHMSVSFSLSSRIKYCPPKKTFPDHFICSLSVSSQCHCKSMRQKICLTCSQNKGRHPINICWKIEWVNNF